MQDDINTRLLQQANDEYRRVKKERTQELYDTIREDYKKIKDKKKWGVQIYTSQYVIHMLAEKYFKSPKTIENIVFLRV